MLRKGYSQCLLKLMHYHKHYIHTQYIYFFQNTETDDKENDDSVDELSNVKLELKKTKVRY